MQLQAFLAAEYFNMTPDGKINVMGIFNSINAQSFPAQHPAMHLVLKFRADLGEATEPKLLTIRLFDEGGHEVIASLRRIDFPPALKWCRTRVQCYSSA